MNYLWAGMILIGIIFGAFNGRMEVITNAALDSSKEAVTLCITMIGIMSFWCGIMEIAAQAGIIGSAAKKNASGDPFSFFLICRKNIKRRSILQQILLRISSVLGGRQLRQD